ncbi:RHTO0S19e00144g1_1 [Rhodotorula toruloides]|uniref:RHTO0S19e00144g1_1 n=2 Tax=Rhodotorula toruloides TaxID=5286 RepID=A0A061BKX0_RHOTO|nr:uncharacterized protein RHTO_03758 [Rhodotorula toruloides NP11]EMS20224.1 hypothetical protein RHTO_03758 [Rhodotorula toruloides NP11]CDR48586.1 RHTO0S19e00144g1_1 [Rhodotorula toruloides]
MTMSVQQEERIKPKASRAKEGESRRPGETRWSSGRSTVADWRTSNQTLFHLCRRMRVLALPTSDFQKASADLDSARRAVLSAM